MKTKTVIKKWQLLWHRSDAPAVDLREAEFLSVGNRAFRRCRGSMEEIRLPEGLSAIKSEAFRGCRRLFSVRLPEDSDVGLGTGALRDCIRLREIAPFERISSIGERAFSGCTMLSQISFGAGLRRIGAYAFRDCASLRSVTVPAHLESIGKGAFLQCTELERVEIEEGVTHLAPAMLRGCISLGDIRIPSTVTALEEDLLRDCSALSSIALPGSVQQVGKNALRGCRRLREARMELGVSAIGAGAFRDCPELREVYLPHSIKRLGFAAFGLGRAEERTRIYVEQEYMVRRMKRMLLFCGSYGRVEVLQSGKTIEERKRERRRSTLEKKVVRLTDAPDEKKDQVEP